MPDVKFTPSDTEMKIDMGNEDRGASVGLTKEEVMKFANDPFWVASRRFLLVLFWILWVLMLVGAVVIIIFTPKCAKPKELLWYEGSPIYTIHVDKFSDSDGDGIGDLLGITKRLEYVQDTISMRAVALEGLLDKSDPSVIRPKLGSMDDFKELASKIKVVIAVPLGEIVSEVDTSNNLERIISNWLDAGAAGFILNEFDSENPAHSDGLQNWFNVVGNYSATEGGEEEADKAILLALSTQGFNALPETYCRYAHMVLNYDMIKLSAGYDSDELYSLLADLAERNRSSSCRDNFVLGSGEILPLGERFQPRSRAEALLIFNLLADATPITYYGDEYGKMDTSSEEKSRELRQMAEPHTGRMQWRDIEAIQLHPEPNQLKLFQQLAKLRLHEPSIRAGKTAVRSMDSTVLAMSRIKHGNPGFVIVSNFGSQKRTVDLRTSLSKQIPAQGSLVLTSTSSKRAKDERLSLEALPLEGEETLVLQFVPESDHDGH